MNDITSTTLSGRLVRAPEVRTSGHGLKVCTFWVAANQAYKAKDEKWKEEVAFVTCVAFGRNAETLAAKGKGDPALFVGRLKSESWEQNDSTQSLLVLVVEQVRCLERRRSNRIDPSPPIGPMTDAAGLSRTMSLITDCGCIALDGFV